MTETIQSILKTLEAKPLPKHLNQLGEECTGQYAEILDVDSRNFPQEVRELGWCLEENCGVMFSILFDVLGEWELYDSVNK